MKDKSFLCFEVCFTILLTIVSAICVKNWICCLCCLCVMIVYDVCYYVIDKTDNCNEMNIEQSKSENKHKDVQRYNDKET